MTDMTHAIEVALATANEHLDAMGDLADALAASPNRTEAADDTMARLIGNATATVAELSFYLLVRTR